MSNPPSILKARKTYGRPRIRTGKAITKAERKFAAEMVKHGERERAVCAAWPAWKSRTDQEQRLEAGRLLTMARVKEEMEAIRAVATRDAGFDAADALAEFLAIYRADPNALASVRVGACRYCHGQGGLYQWRDREYEEAVREAEAKRAILVRRGTADATAAEAHPFPDLAGGTGYNDKAPPNPSCGDCGGEGEARVVAKDTMLLSADGRRLFAGIKMTKYGPEVQTHDRMAALGQAARIIGAFEDKVRVRATVDVGAKVVAITTDDPNAAAEAYKRLMTGGA